MWLSGRMAGELRCIQVVPLRLKYCDFAVSKSQWRLGVAARSPSLSWARPREKRPRLGARGSEPATQRKDLTT